MRVPGTAKRTNQSILKKINLEYSLEVLVLNLKLQYLGHLIQRGTDSLENTLILGKIESKRRRGQERIRWLDCITDSMDVDLSKLQELVEDRGAWCALDHEVTKSQTTKTTFLIYKELLKIERQCAKNEQTHRDHDLKWPLKVKVAQSCLTLCDPMDFSTPGFPVLLYLLEFAQTHVH